LEANEDYSKLLLDKNLSANLNEIKQTLGNSPDVVIREFRPALMRKRHAALIYIDGLVDSITANDSIIQSLMYEVSEQASVHIESSEQFYWYAKESLLLSSPGYQHTCTPAKIFRQYYWPVRACYLYCYWLIPSGNDPEAALFKSGSIAGGFAVSSFY